MMMKKRILQVTANLYIGGAEKVARDIGFYADPERYEFHYVVFGNEIGAYEEDLIARGHKVFHIPSPSSDYAQFVKTLKQMMLEQHYTAVHAHTMFNCGLVLYAAKQCGVPIRIAHSHSAWVNEQSSLKIKAYEAAMRRLILRIATDCVACGVEAGNRLFGEKAFQSRGILILNGIDTVTFSYDESARARIRSELGWEDAFVIGHAGHLASVKNQSFLIDLMPAILKRRPNAKLLLLGEGEDRPLLEQKIAVHNLSHFVKLTGNVMNVSDYLSAMDVFAFPSLFEGMPLAILEVQANGLPCVLSTGVPDDVYLTDLIHPVSLGQPERWLQEICRAKRNGPERYAQLIYQKGFDTYSAMKKIFKIYERADQS